MFLVDWNPPRTSTPVTPTVPNPPTRSRCCRTPATRTLPPSGSLSRRPIVYETAMPPLATLCHSRFEEAVGRAAKERNCDGSTPSTAASFPFTRTLAASSDSAACTRGSRPIFASTRRGSAVGATTNRSAVRSLPSGATPDTWWEVSCATGMANSSERLTPNLGAGRRLTGVTESPEAAGRACATARAGAAGPGRGAAEGPIASVAMAASTAARPGRKTRVLARTALPSAGHSYSRVACLHDHHAGKQARRLYDVGKI